MFRTVIEEIEHSLSIEHPDQILTLGSCFSQEMGNRLADNKFNVSINPFGTIFNPLSIIELLELTLGSRESLGESVIERDGLYYNYKFHSSFHADTKDKLAAQVETSLNLVKSTLTNTKVLFLTFGTAWVHEIKDRKLLVANCHKMPRNGFDKRMLDIQEIIPSFFGIKEMIQEINPDLQIVLTVSPVRHRKETLALNSASKSVLRLACHYLSSMAPDVLYFPSYEVVMDDLRDYRYYDKDLIHLNEQGLDYIWQIFSKTYFSKKTSNTLKQWQEVSRALSHKPFNPDSHKHQQFLLSTLNKLQKLKSVLQVDKEIASIKSQLNTNA